MDAFSNIFSMNKGDAKKAGNFTFITNYFKNPSKQLEEGSEWNQNQWKEFFMGCFMSLFAVMYIGVVSANFIFFSKLPTENIPGEETIHTYFPVAADSPFFSKFFSYPVSDRDYGDYQTGTTDDIETKYGGHLRKLNIPPTGFGDSWFKRFPYNLMDYDPEMTGNWVKQFFYGRLSWLGRTVAATYIFWRKLIQVVLTGTNRVGNFLKILIALLTVTAVVAGPMFLLSLGKQYKGLNFTGFSPIVIASMFIISITQAKYDRANSYLWGAFGPFFQVIFMCIFDIPMLAAMGTTISGFVMPLQFIFTFLLPFNAIMNNGQILDNMGEITGALGIIYTAFCVLFAQLYLNKTIFSGMLLVIVPYLLLQIVKFFKWLIKSLKTKSN